MPGPNILLITTDQHNADILGCAGDPTARTPHLDRLAREGVRFREAYTPHSVCTPARTSIFTGQTADHHGVTYNINLREDRADPPGWTGLAADAMPFPEIFRRAGYHTSLFGKLHTKQAGTRNFGLETTRLAEGKGQFVEFGAAPDDYRRYLHQKGHPDSVWRTWEADGYAEDAWTRSELPLEDYIDTWTATEALRHLETVDGPFCCWVSFSGPHPPWDPPAPYDALFDPESIPLPPRREGELEEKHPDWVDCIAQTIASTPPRSRDPEREGGHAAAYARFPDRQIREMLAAYYGQIALIDAQVGRLLELLDRRGLADSTLVVFTADHGDYLGRNWAFYKYGAQYASLSRVPLLVRCPGTVEAGVVRDEFVSLVDIAPTLLEAAALQPVDPMDGLSLAPLLETASPVPPDWREHIVLNARSQCVVTPEWKYLRWPEGMEELYDRREDPCELRNLTDDPRTASVREKLSALLD
ncbi:MAG: sulfatase-like hydrolase/transferase [Lentisphaeria bacterium]|nr:sulfatase-like hydrolase/transferase [Lentisphaeria bacterium]